MDMSESAYTPKPLDTSAVALPGELAALTERLAENTHELWAQERLVQGWKLGPERNDERKEHPCLVPYSELPESEKQFDRETAMGALKAIVSLGAAVESPCAPPTIAESKSADDWEKWLQGQADKIESDPDNLRSSDFDMNDEPELASGKMDAFPTLRRAIKAFHDDLTPLWRQRDAAAKEIQKRHRRVARWAIVPGVLAIVLAIVQLALSGKGLETCSKCFSVAELIVAVAAALAVWRGFHARTRDRWLVERQAAERLRVVKFRALADPRMWCDFEAWKAKWLAEVKKVRELDFKGAAHWVHSGCSEPVIPESLPCAVPAAEARAIADYYRAKRLRYQGHYFVSKAGEHKRDMWVLRLHLPVLLFFASVLIVIVHVILEVLLPKDGGGGSNGCPAIDGGTHEVLFIILLGLAAALPVIGFGMRAWFSAFELPRRAQLFEGKAEQLKAALQRVKDDRLKPRKTFTHLELGEHFFENEHREWCRLILEAEWFV